jgi:two-component system OmpR family sensor kinase
MNNVNKGLDKQVSSSYEKFSTYFRETKIKTKDIKPYLERFGFEKAFDARRIIRQGRVVADGRGYQNIIYMNKYYYHVQRKGYRRLYRDLNSYGQDSKLDYIGFIFIFLLLLLVYYWLLNSLKPLQTLKENISKFAEGDLTVDCRSEKKDEIAIVSNEFDNAVKQINLLLSSRQLFLRTVMHELKTPIGKGRIVSALVNDEIQEKRLTVIFEKLDYLINDFAKIEEIVSKNYTLKRHTHPVSKIVEQALEMLLLDNVSEELECFIEDTKVKVDLDLMAMVIKNLIDNGLKYSEKHKVKIITSQNRIEVYSIGDALSRPLKEYFKPFHNEADKLKQGMGLGLYIVKSIVDMHKMKFEYKYVNGVNVFSVIW